MVWDRRMERVNVIYTRKLLMRYYDKLWNKRRSIPNKCPRGHKVYDGSKIESIYDMLNSYFMNARIVQVYDNKWKMKRWVMECPVCSMVDQLNKKNRFIDYIKKDYKGSVIKIDFEVERK
jgi:hypothetical protein